MKFKGKHVITMKEFDLRRIHAGDLVSLDVVDELCDISLFEDDFAPCAQPDDPIARRYCEKTGLYYNIYPTFRRIAGWEGQSIWEYCGQCFFAEDEESDMAIINHLINSTLSYADEF